MEIVGIEIGRGEGGKVEENDGETIGLSDPERLSGVHMLSRSESRLTAAKDN